MMKISDLQIGDWIYINPWYSNEPPYPDRVIGIHYHSCNGVVYSNYVYSHTCEKIGIDFILPIPLTKEILEMNGFTRSKVFVEWEYKDDNIYMLFKPFHWIKIELENHTVKIPCEFVHELQHALRLCGINKEIKI